MNLIRGELEGRILVEGGPLPDPSHHLSPNMTSKGILDDFVVGLVLPSGHDLRRAQKIGVKVNRRFLPHKAIMKE